MTLKELLRDKGLSQVEAARQLGYGTPYVNRLCTGAAKLTWPARVRIAYTFGIKPEDLEDTGGTHAIPQ